MYANTAFTEPQCPTKVCERAAAAARVSLRISRQPQPGPGPGDPLLERSSQPNRTPVSTLLPAAQKLLGYPHLVRVSGEPSSRQPSTTGASRTSQQPEHALTLQCGMCVWFAALSLKCEPPGVCCVVAWLVRESRAPLKISCCCWRGSRTPCLYLGPAEQTAD